MIIFAPKFNLKCLFVIAWHATIVFKFTGKLSAIHVLDRNRLHDLIGVHLTMHLV